MSPAELNALRIIHVTSAVGLVAATFYGFAGGPETKKKVMMWGGVATLLLVAAGVRMWAAIYQFHGGWAFVKLGCWLGLSALMGIGYRKRAQAGLWMFVILALAAVAVAMVFTKPF
jgi:hypothetical protein